MPKLKIDPAKLLSQSLDATRECLKQLDEVADKKELAVHEHTAVTKFLKNLRRLELDESDEHADLYDMALKVAKKGLEHLLEMCRNKEMKAHHMQSLATYIDTLNLLDKDAQKRIAERGRDISKLSVEELEKLKAAAAKLVQGSKR